MQRERKAGKLFLVLLGASYMQVTDKGRQPRKECVIHTSPAAKGCHP